MDISAVDWSVTPHRTFDEAGHLVKESRSVAFGVTLRLSRFAFVLVVMRAVLATMVFCRCARRARARATAALVGVVEAAALELDAAGGEDFLRGCAA